MWRLARLRTDWVVDDDDEGLKRRNLSESSDEELIGMIAAGDPTALTALCDRHFSWLTMRLGRRCNDRNGVDEVVQDTFLAVAWAKRFRGESQVAA